MDLTGEKIKAADPYCVGASMKSREGPQSERMVVDPLVKTPGQRVAVAEVTAPGKEVLVPEVGETFR
jgi:hypothetical protein